MDFGNPQFTEAQILSEFIKTDAHMLQAADNPRPPMAVTGAVSWRSDGIKYKKNEVTPSSIDAHLPYKNLCLEADNLGYFSAHTILGDASTQRACMRALTCI